MIFPLFPETLTPTCDFSPFSFLLSFSSPHIAINSGKPLAFRRCSSLCSPSTILRHLLLLPSSSRNHPLSPLPALLPYLFFLIPPSREISPIFLRVLPFFGSIIVILSLVVRRVLCGDGCVMSKKAVSLTPAVESSGVLREHRQGSEVVLVHSSSRRHRAKKEGLAKEEEGDRWDQGDSGKVSIKSTSRRVPRLALQWHRVLSLLSSSATSSTPSPSSSCCSSSSPSPSLSGGVGFWPREMRKGIGRARIKASAEGSGEEHRRRGFASGGPAMEVSASASPSSFPLTTTTSTMVIDRSFGGGDSEFPVWDKLGACKLPRENQWEEREEKEGTARWRQCAASSFSTPFLLA